MTMMQVMLWKLILTFYIDKERKFLASRGFIHFECNRCEYVETSMVLWGRLVYSVNGTKIPIHRELCYCQNCEALTAKEKFDIDKLKTQITHFQRVETSQQGLISRLLSSLKKSNDEDAKKLDAYKLLLESLTNRITNERCLECGSTDVLPFNGDFDLEYENRFYKGVLMTGFKHPNCGGEFIAKGSDIALNIRFEEKLYSLDGKRVA